MRETTQKTILFILFICKCNLYCETTNSYGKFPPKKPNPKSTEKFSPKIKNWNFMVYIASNNDLYSFSTLNINQMKKVGSNENLNILIQQDTPGKAECKRYLVKKGRLKLIEKKIGTSDSISGTTENFYDFIKWGITKYKAKHQAVILWNHGSGIFDPALFGKLRDYYTNKLYTPNPTTGLLELNRNLIHRRGIAFNDVFSTYLTNQDLRVVLRKSYELLNNTKIDILGMDACLMAMAEIGTEVKEYVKIMVASEEAEPGEGWDYSLVLSPLREKNLTPIDFAKHIVESYQKSMQKKYADFTLSAVDLEKQNHIEENINVISQGLVRILNGIDGPQILVTLKKVRRSYKYTTMFANKNYIDLHHFYESLFGQLEKIKKNNNIMDKGALESLQYNIAKGMEIIATNVIARTTCFRLPFAQGISICHPLSRGIHKSYKKTRFAQTTDWTKYLSGYAGR